MMVAVHLMAQGMASRDAVNRAQQVRTLADEAATKPGTQSASVSMHGDQAVAVAEFEAWLRTARTAR